MSLSQTSKKQNNSSKALFQRFFRFAIWNPASEKRGQSFDFGLGRSALKKFLNFFNGEYDNDTGVSVTPESATRLNTVFNCLNVLAQDLASISKHVNQETKDKGRLSLRNQLHKLISKNPNKWETAYHFWYGMVFLGEGWGNSYAYISERDSKGYASELIRIKPWRVTIEIVDGELYYIIDNELAIHNSDMLHYRSFVLDSPIGESKIIYNARTLGMKDKQQKYASVSISNKPPGILFLKHGNSEQAEQNKETWNDFIKNNAGGTPVLTAENFDYKQLMLDPVAAEIIQQNNLSDQYIMGIWRIQPSILSMHEKSNYNVVEQQNIQHVKFALSPLAKCLEEEMNTKLFPQRNKTAEFPEYVKFNFKSLLKGDVKTQTEFYKFLIFYGLANADEIRDWEDLPPQADGVGKDFYHQSSMIKKGEPAEPPKAGTVEGDERTLELLEDFAKKHKLNGYGAPAPVEEN